MENRYKIPSVIQINYLLEVEKKSFLNTENLAIIFGIVPRSYRDWRRGKYPLTCKAVELIEKKFNLKFPYSKEKALLKWKKSKLMASINGGYARLKMYGSPGTPEGRSKGGKNAISILRKRGVAVSIKPFISPKLSAELAEFIGIMLGDGHLDSGYWKISLNSKADEKYIPNVEKLIKKIFGFSPKLFKRNKDNTTSIYYYSVLCSKYLQSIGLKTGDKVKQQVGVPEWIQNNNKFSHSCLKGMMDTDGGIFIHSYKVNTKKYSYLKLCFVNRSLPLLNFVFSTLSSIGLTPKLIDHVENKRVWLYNMHEVNKYLEIIGTRNPRLLKKID